MPHNFSLSLSTLFGFLFVLARVAGTFVFVPLPGVKNGPEMARAVLAVAITIALFGQWPQVPGVAESVGRLAGYLLLEAAIGISIGLSVAFVIESLQMAAQITGLQAGYGYASTIDPSTQADSGVLLVFAQLAAGMMFFSLGLDREVLRAFATSLQSFPPGTFSLSHQTAEAFVKLGSGMFSVGLRLALPAVALLGLVDLTLALLGRLNTQMQLLSLSFPIKMLVALALLAWLAAIYPRVFAGYAGHMIEATRFLNRSAAMAH